MGEQITFVAMARREVENTMNAWHELKVKEAEDTEGHLDNLYQLADKLVSTQIMLLRAIEEVGNVPWWRRGKFGRRPSNARAREG